MSDSAVPRPATPSPGSLSKRPFSFPDRTNPYSGRGVEFYPMGIMPDHCEVVLHETGFLSQNRAWNFPRILSPYWRCYYNFRAGHRVRFPDRTYSLNPAQIILVPDHHFFDAEGISPVPHFWMHFHVAQQLGFNHPVPIVLKITPLERSLMERIRRRILTQKNENHRRPIFHDSLALIHILINRPEISWSPYAFSEGIRRVIHFIEEQYNRSLRISELARMAGLSPRHFMEIFKAHLGVSPGRHLARVRVRKVVQFLTQTDAGLEAIAEQTGFPNRDYLSRVFKKVTGESPAAFRKKHWSKREDEAGTIS